MSIYPIVKLPSRVKRAYQEDFTQSVFNAQHVTHPGEQPRQFNWGVLGAESCAAVLCCAVANYYMGWFVGGAVLISGILLLISQVAAMQASFGQRWYDYRQQVDQFQRQQWEADFERTRHERLQTHEGLSSYRRQRIAELLACATTPGANDTEINLFPEFFVALEKWFPGKIHFGVGSGLMLIDQNSRLHISVMVDQIPQRVAGVAAGSFMEDDQYLHEGWIVVRFSAEQTRLHADSCCKTLAEIGAELLQSSVWLRPFAEVYDLWQIPEDLSSPEFAVSQFKTYANEARAS
jgi:hypothetical protein